jgi:hypothetical protein
MPLFLIRWLRTGTRGEMTPLLWILLGVIALGVVAKAFL